MAHLKNVGGDEFTNKTLFILNDWVSSSLFTKLLTHLPAALHKIMITSLLFELFICKGASAQNTQFVAPNLLAIFRIYIFKNRVFNWIR